MAGKRTPTVKPRAGRARASKPGARTAAPSPKGAKRATSAKRPATLLLRLYIAGTSARSTRAIQNARKICDEHLEGRYQLEVIDILQQPALAKDHQILAVPTLIRALPVPLRRFIGDLSAQEVVVFGLDLKTR